MNLKCEHCGYVPIDAICLDRRCPFIRNEFNQIIGEKKPIKEPDKKSDLLPK